MQNGMTSTGLDPNLDLNSALECLERRLQELDPEYGVAMDVAMRELSEGPHEDGIPVDLGVLEADLRRVVLSCCSPEEIGKMTREQAYDAFTLLNQMHNTGKCWSSLLPYGDKAHELWCAAERAAQNAYAPYTGRHIGAAILTPSGKIHSGCRVESADCECIHAEEAALASMINAGEHSLIMLAVVTWEKGEPYGRATSPCGGSLQKLIEFTSLSDHDPDVIDDYLALAFGRDYKTIKLSKLLPGSRAPVARIKQRA